MIAGKKALLLDMNGTFMFGQDRFDEGEDFSVQYRKLGGSKPAREINQIIRAAYDYLDERYTDEAYRHQFPSVETAIREICDGDLDAEETEKIVATFACHELGHIPDEYIAVLHELHQRYTLAAVIDIWAPSTYWVNLFRKVGIIDVFSALFFSSDHGIVKPSPRPFEYVLSVINMRPADAVMIGDSVRRDLGGARRAGVDCILVGGAQHPDAVMCLENLLALRRFL